jgi:hypothetical protein
MTTSAKGKCNVSYGCADNVDDVEYDRCWEFDKECVRQTPVPRKRRTVGVTARWVGDATGTEVVAHKLIGGLLIWSKRCMS